MSDWMRSSPPGLHCPFCLDIYEIGDPNHMAELTTNPHWTQADLASQYIHAHIQWCEGEYCFEHEGHCRLETNGPRADYPTDECEFVTAPRAGFVELNELSGLGTFWIPDRGDALMREA